MAKKSKPDEISRSAREIAMRLLFGYEKNRDAEPLNAVKALSSLAYNTNYEADFDYLSRIAELIPDRLAQIDKEIEDNSHKWKMDRISRVDLAIMRLALLEMENLGIRTGEAVNAAVELSRQYSQEKAYQFVNGVLGGCISRGANAKKADTPEGAER